MVLNAVDNLIRKLYNGACSAISANKKIFFILAPFLTTAAAFIFSYFSRISLNLAHVIGISGFCVLIYYNMAYASKNYRKAIAYVFAISMAFQLYLGWQFIGVEHDINNQMNAALAIRDGKSIYTDVHPFYPGMPI